MPRLAAVAVLCAILIPGQASAQQADGPGTLVISSWICPQAELARIAAAYDSITRPVEDELVREGRLSGAGLFFHDWADEWNVNHYRSVANRAAAFEVAEEVSRRVAQRHPGAGNIYAACSAHKDNIYAWGPRTAPQ